MYLKKIFIFIGIEIHSHIINKKKLLSFLNYNYKKNFIYQNSNICYLDLGIPGVLPVLNSIILYKIVLFGLFIGGLIFFISFFVRKSYCYNDMSKNYQITQYKYSIIKNGKILIYNNYVLFPYYKFVKIKQIHIEEDAGKILYYNYSFNVDYNRAGCCLLEIVSDYNLYDFYETYLYIKKVQKLLKILNISYINMETGFFRFDVNISVNFCEYKYLNNKSELKNLNSFSTFKDNLEFEIKRHINLLIKNKIINQETRFYNLNNYITYFYRNKEYSYNYKYFKDPDFYPLLIISKLINIFKFKILNLIFIIKKILKKNFFFNYYINVLNLKILYFLINLLLKFKKKKLIIFIWCINNLKFFEKKFFFSINNLLIIFKLYQFKYISFLNIKELFIFLNKHNNLNNLFIYNIIIYNNLKIIYFKKKYFFYFNKNIIYNLFLVHNFIKNKKIINFLTKNIFKNILFKINCSEIYNFFYKKFIY